jgi:hypothetical protein
MTKKGSRKDRKAKKARTDLIVTPISEHKKVGKDVIPPLAQLKQYPNMAPADWTGERLPEMLWASMLIAALGRDEALERFRRLGVFIQDRCHEDASRRTTLCKVTFTGLAAWDDNEFDEFVGAVIRDDAEIFSSLTIFDSLPDAARWRSIVPRHEPVSLDVLKVAVGITLWHQSQEATDCRWMKVLAMTLSGSLQFPAGAEEKVKEILEYPNYGDQRGVRPSIRSTEMIADTGPQGPIRSEWAPQFWHAAFELTRNDHDRFSPALKPIDPVTTIDRIKSVRDALRLHAEATTQGTAVDPRHEAAFGLVAYSLDILLELMSLSNSTSILGRMGLRSITELLINFTTLAKRDEADRWQRFRDYGYGQAKLAYLKLLETETLPAFVTVESLEALANEDVWHEFREMHIGNWADADLRKMSEAQGIKEAVYDKYYDWSSAFVHANWAALRDAEYDLCVNPLHRLHRIVTTSKKAQPDVISDAVELVNQALALLDALYPTFDQRL